MLYIIDSILHNLLKTIFNVNMILCNFTAFLFKIDQTLCNLYKVLFKNSCNFMIFSHSFYKKKTDPHQSKSVHIF